MEGVECHAKDATIRWKSMGDNRAPISHYIIEYNTTFTPETWTAASNNVPATDMSYNVSSGRTQPLKTYITGNFLSRFP